LTAIEQWFNVLSAAERTAALYSLLQSCTPVQIRFFITVLQQLARNDPDNPLLSPTTSASAYAFEGALFDALIRYSFYARPDGS
jgi:hypothetical protein